MLAYSFYMIILFGEFTMQITPLLLYVILTNIDTTGSGPLMMTYWLH